MAFNLTKCYNNLGALFDSSSPLTEAVAVARREAALKNFQDFLKPILTVVTGPQKFDEGTEMVFLALQVNRDDYNREH